MISIFQVYCSCNVMVMMSDLWSIVQCAGLTLSYCTAG